MLPPVASHKLFSPNGALPPSLVDFLTKGHCLSFVLVLPFLSPRYWINLFSCHPQLPWPNAG